MAGKHTKTNSEWEEDISIKIINQTRNELYVDLRFLRNALWALTPKKNDSLSSFATNGINISYNATWLMKVYKNNPLFVNRAYLHTMLHCLFSHLWFGENKDKILYGLACDIIVEYTIDSIDKPCVKRIIGWVRQHCYEMVDKEKMYSAALIYQWLTKLDDKKIQDLKKEFITDSHYFWPDKNDKENKTFSQGIHKWNKISRQTKLESNLWADESKDGQELFFAQMKGEVSKRNYGDFLKKFMVIREELKCDPDEFDLNYYTYGLSTYGNMPLIEPLETKESRKIQEIVIVIDTSYSTSGSLVRDFLNETFSLIKDEKSFFKDSIIRVIQCDDKVMSDDVITSKKQIDEIFSRFEVKGGSGTDFRPAFNYVNNLIEEGIIKKLGGLLYFTDGKGVYPKKKPSYKTAFIYTRDYDMTNAPIWAIKYHLEPDDLKNNLESTEKRYEYQRSKK